MRQLSAIGGLACAIILTAGCAHTQLRWNTTHQAKTLTDIYEQQVLDNLAMFVHDPNSLPSFAYPNQGGADVTDGGSLGSDTTWKRLGFDTEVLKLGASRNMKQAWTLTPVYDVRRLELMRCSYQHALFCAGLCATGDCCPDCDRLQRTFYLGDPKGRYDEEDSKNHLGTFSTKTGRTTPACFEAMQWLGCGDRKSAPHRRDCLKVGHYCGTYVWVLPAGQNELTKLTMTILDYAFSPQATKRTKDVTMFFDKDGNLVNQYSDRALEVKTTVAYDKPIPLKTIKELSEKPFDSNSIPELNDLNLTPDQMKAIDHALAENAVDQPFDVSTIRSEAMLNEKQKSQIKNAVEKARAPFRERRDQLQSLIGEPESSPPPIMSPPSGFSPLPFQLYQQTLTPPTP